ncbi:MAG: multidrug resistance protein family, partial [Pseudonocardiales bacterium]|nr:multidrug resistance protein family [Pseudonocardiales bacterium]
AGVAGALIMIGCGRLLGLLSQDARFAAPAQAMLIALAPGLLPYLWCQALRQYGLGMRRPAASTRVTLLSVGLNLGLSWVLGFGAGPVPGFGVAGIGAATAWSSCSAAGCCTSPCAGTRCSRRCCHWPAGAPPGRRCAGC